MKKTKTLMSILLLLGSVFMLSLAAAGTLTIRPDGQGTYTQFAHKGCSSGSNEWKCVDEVTASTSDRLQKGRNNKKESFTFSNTGLTDETINSVTIYYYAKRQTSNKNKMQSLIRSGTTNYYGSIKSLGSSYGYVSEVYTTNPATGNAWTISEVDGLQAGMRTATSNGGAKVAQVYAVVNHSPSQTCGNNLIEGTEVCDGTDLGGASCSSQGFDGGTLSCNSACTALVTTSCWDNSCSDTDGGFMALFFGTVSGSLSGSSYSYNDTCVNSTHLTEYHCSGNSWTNTEFDCTTNATSCSAGACV